VLLVFSGKKPCKRSTIAVYQNTCEIQTQILAAGLTVFFARPSRAQLSSGARRSHTSQFSPASSSFLSCSAGLKLVISLLLPQLSSPPNPNRRARRRRPSSPTPHLTASFTSGEPPPPLPPEEEATGILPSRPPFLLLQGWRRRRFSGLCGGPRRWPRCDW
jgi:hypothetical protein